MSYSTKYFRFVEGDAPSLTPDVFVALRDPVFEAILAGGAVSL